MRVLVVGAGLNGAKVIRQLMKNPAITIITSDPREDPYALEEGLIEAVDIQEALTPLTLDYVLRQAKADLILLTTSTEDLGLGRAPGIDILAGSLRDELAAIASAPVIEVARSGL